PTLLIGPSGSGKTLLATRAARLAGLPYACHDLTSLTATGWVGMNTNDLLTALITRAEGQFPIARHGLLFLDEVDKLRSRETVGVDVGGQGAQRCLLALLDGGQVEIEWPPTGPRDGRAWHPFSCARLLTILAGAFAGLDEIIAKRVGGKRRLGFAAGQTCEPVARHDLLCQVTAEDLIAYGMIPDLVGRLNIVVMRELPREALRDILVKAPDGPLAIQQRMASREGYHLKLTDDLVEAIVDRAVTQGLGARPLHAMLSQACRSAAYEVPSRINPLADGRYTVELGVGALLDGAYQLSHRRARRSAGSQAQAEETLTKHENEGAAATS
ncbi:MAG: AAA family ATPase, partial [Armatimonadia bacterium]